MTVREHMATMAEAAVVAFEDEPGSPRSVNAALLVIACALVALHVPVGGLDDPRAGFTPWHKEAA